MFVLFIIVKITSIWQAISINPLITNVKKCFHHFAQTVAWKSFQPLTYIDVKEFIWYVKWYKNTKPIDIYAKNTVNAIRKVTAGVYADHSYALKWKLNVKYRGTAAFNQQMVNATPPHGGIQLPILPKKTQQKTNSRSWQFLDCNFVPMQLLRLASWIFQWCLILWHQEAYSCCWPVMEQKFVFLQNDPVAMHMPQLLKLYPPVNVYKAPLLITLNIKINWAVNNLTKIRRECKPHSAPLFNAWFQSM